MAAKLIKYIDTHILIYIISILKNVYRWLNNVQLHYFFLQLLVC